MCPFYYRNIPGVPFMFCLFRAQSLLQHWRSHFHALYRRVVFERARLLFSQPYIRIGPCKRSAVFTGDVPEVSIAHRPRPLDGWRRRWWGHWTHKKNFGYDAPSSIAAGVGNSKKKDGLRFFWQPIELQILIVWLYYSFRYRNYIEIIS